MIVENNDTRRLVFILMIIILIDERTHEHTKLQPQKQSKERILPRQFCRHNIYNSVNVCQLLSLVSAPKTQKRLDKNQSDKTINFSINCAKRLNNNIACRSLMLKLPSLPPRLPYMALTNQSSVFR